MKLIILGDLHIRSSNPESRIDDYKKSMFEKLNYVFDYAYDKVQSDATILLPGDVFDSPIQSNATLAKVIELFKFYEHQYQIIWGQHDLKFRNKGNTALDVLLSGGIVQYSKQTTLSESVFLYSVSWGEDISEITTSGFNILLIHKMIVEEKLWEEQVEFEWANTILRRTKFDLIVSGDNHKSFFVNYKDRTLINCGSLMRINRDQINHKPCFVIYNTNTRTYKIHYIPIQPAEEVFDMQKIGVEKERDEKLAAFVDGLVEGAELGLDFAENLRQVLKKNNVEQEVRDIINEAMKEQ